MKLYTEEEIKRLLKEQIIFDDEDFDKLTPIELPSDEEIEDAALSFCNSQELSSDTSYYGFWGATQWLLRKLQGGNNEHI